MTSPKSSSSRLINNKTHYEILGVSKSSSTTDIKSAFLELSKCHHPDLNPDPSSHHTFVRIIEAYTVLSRPELRSTYDSRLNAAAVRPFSSSSTSSPFYPDDEWRVETNAPRWRDETIWEMRDKDRDKFYEDKPYYGIKGLKKVNNLWIAGGAVFLMFIGAAFHFVALRKSSAFTTSQLDERDLRLGIHLKRARQLALQNGNSRQLEIFERKFQEQSNGASEGR